MKKKQYKHLTEHDRIRIVLRLALTSSRGWLRPRADRTILRIEGYYHFIHKGSSVCPLAVGSI